MARWIIITATLLLATSTAAQIVIQAYEEAICAYFTFDIAFLD